MPPEASPKRFLKERKSLVEFLRNQCPGIDNTAARGLWESATRSAGRAPLYPFLWPETTDALLRRPILLSLWTTCDVCMAFMEEGAVPAEDASWVVVAIRNSLNEVARIRLLTAKRHRERGTEKVRSWLTAKSDRSDQADTNAKEVLKEFVHFADYPRGLTRLEPRTPPDEGIDIDFRSGGGDALVSSVVLRTVAHYARSLEPAAQIQAGVQVDAESLCRDLLVQPGSSAGWWKQVLETANDGRTLSSPAAHVTVPPQTWTALRKQLWELTSADKKHWWADADEFLEGAIAIDAAAKASHVARNVRIASSLCIVGTSGLLNNADLKAKCRGSLTTLLQDDDVKDILERAPHRLALSELARVVDDLAIVVAWITSSIEMGTLADGDLGRHAELARATLAPLYSELLDRALQELVMHGRLPLEALPTWFIARSDVVQWPGVDASLVALALLRARRHVKASGIGEDVRVALGSLIAPHVQLAQDHPIPIAHPIFQSAAAELSNAVVRDPTLAWRVRRAGGVIPELFRGGVEPGVVRVSGLKHSEALTVYSAAHALSALAIYAADSDQVAGVSDAQSGPEFAVLNELNALKEHKGRFDRAVSRLDKVRITAHVLALMLVFLQWPKAGEPFSYFSLIVVAAMCLLGTCDAILNGFRDSSRVVAELNLSQKVGACGYAVITILGVSLYEENVAKLAKLLSDVSSALVAGFIGGVIVIVGFIVWSWFTADKKIVRYILQGIEGAVLAAVGWSSPRVHEKILGSPEDGE